MPDNSVALLCTMHPTSHEAQRKILSLLRAGARSYYRQPGAQCTTWTYFTAHPPSHASTLKAPLVCGLEMYAEKTALQRQLDDREFFQSFQAAVREQRLYRAPEELQAWYLAGGFVVREGREGDGRGGAGCLVGLTRLRGQREGVLEGLRELVPFVRDEEPDVLTYALFTRPKAPKEVLVFVRYRDWKAFRRHAHAAEHVAVVDKLSKLIEGDVSHATTMWREVEDSFVSTQVGGFPTESKL